MAAYRQVDGLVTCGLNQLRAQRSVMDIELYLLPLNRTNVSKYTEQQSFFEHGKFSNTIFYKVYSNTFKVWWDLQ